MVGPEHRLGDLLDGDVGRLGRVGRGDDGRGVHDGGRALQRGVLGGLDALAVDQPQAGLGLPPFGHLGLLAQWIMHAGLGAIAAPAAEPLPHSVPGREVAGQIAPGAPRLEHVEDRVDDVAAVPATRRAPPISISGGISGSINAHSASSRSLE